MEYIGVCIYFFSFLFSEHFTFLSSNYWENNQPILAVNDLSMNILTLFQRQPTNGNSIIIVGHVCRLTSFLKQIRTKGCYKYKT